MLNQVAILIAAAVIISAPTIFGISQASAVFTRGQTQQELQQQQAHPSSPFTCTYTVNAVAHPGETVNNIQSAMAKRAPDDSVVVSGPNIYAAWTCYNHVLFAKSNDGGKTFGNTMRLSAPDINPKIHVMNDNVSLSASGNTVAILWNSNKTGIENPVVRTSSDGGNTFSNILTLNSTPGGVNKPIGANITAGSNATGAAGNATGGSPIHKAKPAGLPDASSLLLQPGHSGPFVDLEPSRQHKVLPPTPPP